MDNNKKVIVFGNDHTNSMGVVQSLGLKEYYVIVFVWGVKRGLLQSSRFTKELFSAADAQGCVEKMLSVLNNEQSPIPIIACCDTAALILEKNVDRLHGKFIFEYVGGEFSLAQLQEKNLQVRLAKEAGFYIPCSIELDKIQDLPKVTSIDEPYLIKPLMSIEGAKSDIIVCENKAELEEKATAVLAHTPRILIQQYIEKDYELSILGCAKKNGEVLIPAKEIKLTIFPPKTGLESKAIMSEMTETSLISAIKSLVNRIKYVGPFSVELMHNSKDNQFYFTEINLRNDGAQPFVRQYGYNLPVIHVNDLLDMPTELPKKTHPGQYLWEMHHYQAWRHHHISFMTWLTDIIKTRGFLLSCKRDVKPFFKQFQTIIRGFLKLKSLPSQFYQ